MPLDQDEVKRLLDLVVATRDDEIDCDACLRDMAEFAEVELVGRGVPEALARIAEHIASCPECAEEYGALMEVLRSADPEVER